MNYHRDSREISQSQTILMPGTLAYAQDSFSLRVSNRRAQRHSKHKTEQKHKRSTTEVPPWNGH